MSNFLKFIEEDISAKKTLLATAPVKTKRDLKKYQETLQTMQSKYQEYQKSVKKYLDTKSRSFAIKNKENKAITITKQINNYEHVRFILNPTNTYFEKMGFDTLLYRISNYYQFNFNCLNEIINEFLDQFELVQIKITKHDFDYTCYVYEYMTSFLEVRTGKVKGYQEVATVFEKIYWVNPDLISHIELNFRKLIKKYEKTFINYILELQRQVMLENKINNYDDCLQKLNKAYLELNELNGEGIGDIIALAKTGEIDINHYFPESKMRTTAYNSLMIEPIEKTDELRINNFYANLKKLKHNLIEFNYYLQFKPLFEKFKTDYEKQIPQPKANNQVQINKQLKEIMTKINNKETKLNKINKKIFSDGLGFFVFKNDKVVKQLKNEALKQAQQLYKLYQEYDQVYYQDKVLSILNKSLTVGELLQLFYSFDRFKKQMIKTVFAVTTYDEVMTYSDNFDLFAMNPTNIITKGITLFEEINTGRVITNRYRLDNINITEDLLTETEIEALKEKIQFVLRIQEIENSKTTVEKIWFIAQVASFNK